MAIDPRLELARRMAGGQGGSYGGGGSLQQEAAARFAALKNKKSQQQIAEPDGWKGIVSAAFDNPVAKTVLAPLSLLDYGRAGIVSGIKEIADTLDTNPETKGSFGELLSQTKNHIGFGDIEQLHTNNKWLDRIIGFTGDVALDPLTWTTLGAGHLSSMTGRVGLAADIAEKGAAKVSANEITKLALEDIVNRAGKNGLSKLTAVEREMFNLPKAGLRFGRPFAKEAGKGILIPGTEGLAEKLGSGLGSAKNALMSSKPITKLTMTGEGVLRRAPEGLEQAFTKLATGKGNVTATQAAAFVGANTEKASVGSAFTNVWSRVADNVMKDTIKSPEGRVALTHMVESGDLSNNVAAGVRSWFDNVRNAFLKETGKAPENVGYRTNYMPHVWSKEGSAVLAGNTEVAQDLRKIMQVSVDEVKTAGPTLERKIEAGTYKIAGKDVTFNSGTIDDINSVLAREFPDVFKGGVKALEEDSLKLMAHYANAMGRGVGDDAFAKKLLAINVGIDSGEAMHLVKDVGGTRSANKVLHEELRGELKGTDAAIKAAKANAHSSMKAAVEHVGNVMRTKLQGLVRRSNSLDTQFGKLASKLADETISFDAKLMLLNDAELAARDSYDRAVALSESLKSRYDAEFGAVEQAGKDAEKGRLAAARQAKAAIQTAEGDVAAIKAQIDAYGSLKETVSKLNGDIKAMVDGVEFKDIPEGVKTAAQNRTVAKQQSIDSASTRAAEEVNVVVTAGSGKNESFGLMKKLKLDEKAVGSALKQTTNAAGAHLGEAYHPQIAAIKDMIDQAVGRTLNVSEEVSNKAAKIVADAEDRVAKAKFDLEFSKKNYTARNIADKESKLRNAEKGLGFAKEEADAILNPKVKNQLTFNQGSMQAYPEAKFKKFANSDIEEQFSKQIEFAKNELKKTVFEETVASTGSVVAAQANADVVENLVKSIEVTARARRSPVGSASFIAAAQMTLEESVTNARISTDFVNRLKAVTQVIEQSGQQLTAVQQQAVENLVMREVLTTEREAIQEKVRKLTSSLEHYADKEGNVVNKTNIAKTKAVQAGTKRANETWDILRLYLDELFSTTREAGLRQGVDTADFAIGSATSREVIGRSAEEAANSGFSIYETGVAGKTSRAQQQAFSQAKRELKQAIADILFEGDKRAASQYAESGQLDRLLNKISSGYGPESKAAWTEEFKRIFLARDASTIVKGNKTSKWLATAAQGAEKEIEVLTERKLQTDRLIQRLRPTGVGVDSAANQASVAFFQEQADIFSKQLAQLRAMGTFQGKEYSQVKYYADRFAEVANERATSGIPKGAPRLTAAEVLSGKVRPSGVSKVDKELKVAREALIVAEQEMEKIVTTGALKNAVQDVPGRASPFNKAKRYISVIDEEIGIIKARVKGMTNQQARKESLQYVRTLTNEKTKLEGLIKSAEPLEDRLISAKVVLQDAKDAAKALPKKAALAAETAGNLAGVRARQEALAAGRTAQEALKASQIANVEVAKETLRETFDATVASTRDAMGTINTARDEIDSLIPAIEEQVRTIPKVGKNVDREKLFDYTEWLSDSYDMMDEQLLVERLFNMPGDMTPDLLKPGRNVSGVTNPEMIAFLRSLPPDPSTQTALALIYKAHKDTGSLLTLLSEKEAIKAQIQMAKDGNLITMMHRVAKDGLQELADSGIYVPREVANMMERLVTIDENASRKLMEALNKYTEIWKAVKTTSPRFHVRNAMSATFMNYVAGVKSENMIKGVNYWRLFEQDPVNWLEKIPKAEREYAKAALEDVFGSGGGQFSEIAAANSSLSNKGVFKMSQKKGVQVEGYVRMGMALDSRLPAELGGKGFARDLSVSRISKYHFNYGQLSKFDRDAKAFIPFWTFMSRNLPLQIEQMWMNPKAYAIYNSFARNMNAGGEGDIVPQYIKETGGFKLPFGQDLYMTPDIGMNRVQQDIAQFRDPLRLGQNLNPLFKTPLEYWAGKQFYKDIPLSENQYVPLRGAGKALQPLAELLGAVQTSSDGTPTINEKNYYAGMQLIPGLQELERLVAPGQKYYQDKQGMSLLNFLTGAPVTKVTASAKQSEQDRAKRELAKRKATQKAVNKGARQ